MFPLCRILDTLKAFLIKDSDWDSLKTVLFCFDILKYFDLILSLLMSTSCPITLIVYCPVLLLFLIILFRLSVCFKLMLSILSLLAFCLLMPILSVSLSVSYVDREKSISREKHQLPIAIVLPLMYHKLSSFSSVHSLFKG